MHAEGSDPFPSCDVCGRTLLKGEQVHEYLTQQHSRKVVCIHCRSRAEAAGWIPVAMAATLASEPPSRARRGQAIRERLGRAASRARTTAARAASKETAPPEGPRKRASKRPEPKAARPGSREGAKRQPAATGPAPEPRPQPKPRRGPEALMRRAVERFNGSAERRKVAGLIRSLGEPHAAVTADPARQLALVTVAWELSWYQWEVGADGDAEPVREVGKGKEMSELGEDAPTWNARVAEDGKLRLRSRSRKPAAKKA